MKIRGRLFLVDDDELIISMLARSLKKEGYEVRIETSGKNLVKQVDDWHPDILLLDINLGEERDGIDLLEELKQEQIDTAVVMLTSDDTAESAIRCMKLGAADYLTKPFNIEEVKMVIEAMLEKLRLKEEVTYLRKFEGSASSGEMIAESPVMRKIAEQVKTLAEAKATIFLITGESGTGKEVMARYFHRLCYAGEFDKGRHVPFITVNCTALPENLIESELFGHTKWAFTDARTDKKGVFELADGGSLLLDEIGDMRLDLQSKFLRVLEERKVRRLGGKVDLPVDVTVIATTNRNLKEAVQNKQFREDLFFRLNTFAIDLPPLRERPDDIPLLARHFLSVFTNRYYKKDIKGFSPEAEKALCSYSWPGNIRELKNVVERCVVLEKEEILTPQHLPGEISGTKPADELPDCRLVLPEDGLALEEVEKELIRQALDRSGNNQTKAAKLLRISYDTLRYQAKKFNLL